MKKLLVAVTTVALIVPTGISWSAVKTGQKCTKAGAVRVVKNLEYKCIKKNGKLVWGKGELRRFGGSFEPGSGTAATPSASPTPSAPSPTTTPTPSPSTTPVIRSDYAKAFDEIERAYRASKPVDVNFNFIFSKDANAKFGSLLKETIEKSARLWESLYTPSGDFPVVLGNPKDLQWVEETIGRYGHKINDYQMRIIKSQGDRASRGYVEINERNVITFYVIGDRYASPDSSTMAFISHEYVHSVQVSLYKSRESGLPQWAIEGSATFFGDAMSSIISGKGINEYANLRRGSVRNSYPASLALNTLTRDDLYLLIKSIENGGEQQKCAEPQLVCYTAGAALTEKLIADFGFNEFVNWWKLSATKDWYPAFEEAFGVNLDTWYQESGVPHVQGAAQDAIPEERIPSPNTFTLKPKRITDPLERWDATGSDALKIYRKWGTSKLGEQPKTKIEYHFSSNFWKDTEKVFRDRFDSVVAYWDRLLDIQIPIYFMAGTKSDVEWICKVLESKDPQRRRAAGCIESETQALQESNFGPARGFDLTNGSANFYLVNFKEVGDSVGFKPRIEHEYFHSVQQNLLRNRFRTNIPCWFLEGGSEYFGLLTSTHGDAELFLKLRRHTILGAPEKRRAGVTAQELTDWLNAATVAWQLAPEAWASNCSPFGRNGLYHDGILATEWLVNRIGVDGVLALTKDAAATSWADAFEKKVGLPVKEAHRLIGEYMLKERVIAEDNNWMSIVFCNNAGNPGPTKSPPGCWWW